jgi:hypothetical protein
MWLPLAGFRSPRKVSARAAGFLTQPRKGDSEFSVATPQRIHIDAYDIYMYKYMTVYTHTHTTHMYTYIYTHIQKALLRRPTRPQQCKTVRCWAKILPQRLSWLLYCPSCAAVGGIHWDSPVTLFHLHTAAPEESVPCSSAPWTGAPHSGKPLWRRQWRAPVVYV